MKTPTTARVGSVLASFGVFLFLIPPVFVGAIAANTGGAVFRLN